MDNRLVIRIALAMLAVITVVPTAHAAYLSVLFGTDSQAQGNFAQEAVNLDTALKKWDNWATAARAGGMQIVNKDSTITGALDALKTTPTAANDFVLFLYSGHGGFYNNSVEGAPALDPQDERLSTYKNATGWTRESDDSVATAFAALNQNAFKLGIFASCYAGGMWGEPDFDLNRVANTAMYGSASELQPAPMVDPFITALISSMSDKSADLNSDRKVTVQEWFTRAKGVVGTANPQYFYVNTPTRDDIGSGPSDFYAEPVYYPYDSPFGNGQFNNIVVAFDVSAPATLWLLCAGLLTAWISRKAAVLTQG